MEDILSIIEDAADELTRNERKSKGKKKDYTASELKDMLKEQELQKEENRAGLEKKLKDICEKTQREFNISYISTGMMQKVALMISKEISNETITSLQNVEKSGGVVKVLHEEATKIQLIENYEAMLDGRKPPHENIPYYSDTAKLIVSNPEVAVAIDFINTLNETDKEADKLLENMNEENADEIAGKLADLMETDEFKDFETNRAKKDGIALQVAEDSGEQRIICADIEHSEAAARCRVNPDNDNAFVGLMHHYMVVLNLKKAPIDRIIADMKLDLLSNKKLTINQRVELNKLINEFEKQKNPQNLLEFLAERVAELNPNISKEDALKAAEDAAKAHIDPSRIDSDFLKSQARVIFGDDKKYVDYCDLTNSIYALNNNTQEIDWEKVEGVKSETLDLYAMTLAALNKKTEELDDKTYYKKTQELIETYVEEEKSTTKDDVLYVKAKQTGKSINESMYWEFSRNAMANPESLESIKKSRIGLIEKLDYLTPEEKEEEIRKVEQIQTIDDAIEYGAEGIVKEKTRQGKTADIDVIRKNLVGEKEKTPQEEVRERVKKERKAETAKAIARVKATTIQSKYYEKYIQTMEMLSHVKKDADVVLDNELLDYLKEHDQKSYQELCDKYAGCSNAFLKNAIEQRVKKEHYAEILQAKHREESEKSAEAKTQTIENDAEIANDKQTVQMKKVEDAVVIEGEETVVEGDSPTILQAVEGVIEDVVSTITDSDDFIKKSKNDDEREDR